MNQQETPVFSAADILLPKKGCDWEKWAVVACDQYTSQPEYWERVQDAVKAAPSTYHLMLPELFLEEADVGARIKAIHGAMEQYLADGVLQEIQGRYIYVERTISSGAVRRGVVGKLDLEAYEYKKDAKSPVRPTEGTIEDRLPPRAAVRLGAALELPHIMVFIDDPAQTVIEPLAQKKEQFDALYDFELMEHGGKIRGFAVDGDSAAALDTALCALSDTQTGEKSPLVFAMGDGNHSLATAKTCWEQIKQGLTEEERAAHPARYALVELVNLHDSSIVFEPIHRVLFDVEPAHVMAELEKQYPISTGEAVFEACYAEKSVTARSQIMNGKNVVALLQAFLDEYLQKHGGRIDYIHGDDTARELGAGKNAIAFLLPAMDKSLLFASVRENGALPRKTFSMGHAEDKRYYLECRKIK